MKKSILITFILVCIIPSLLLGIFHISDGTKNNLSIDDLGLEVTTEPSNQEAEIKQENNISISVLKNNKTVEMPLEEYVVSVVLAEMPADFDIEALKAQAVVTRTYTCRKIDNPKHKNASVCTDSVCCQAYVEIESYLSSGGQKESIEKVRSAVESTAGQVLKYQNQLIEATYFSCSGGKTEDAAAVWGSDVPYLQSVDSPGEEISAHFTDTVRFTPQVFSAKLGVSLTGNPGKWIEKVSYTSGGGVQTITIQGNTFTGTEIRQLLDLRSTAFAITIAGNTVTITTKGYGHRVGMSQYGAEAMAVSGKGYQDILSHYYIGTTLSNLTG